MRTTESKIKQAILHPEDEVRSTALAYFARSHSADESIMPLVIEAVEQFGRNKAFSILRGADSLPQTEATIGWLTEELSKDWSLGDVGNDNYCFAVALILCDARTDLLLPEMADLRCFPEELQGWFHERLKMASWGWGTGWNTLEEYGRGVREQGEYRIRDIRRGGRIIESLARHRKKGDVILPLLHRRYRGRDRNLMEWLECFIVELAGMMRLEEAVPILVERLHEDDMSLSDSCLTALKWIGTDRVVKMIAEQWRKGNSDFRRSAAEVMEHIHSDLSAEKCLDFFQAEQDEDAKNFLANALLGHFVFAAVEPIRQMVVDSDEDLTPDEMDLKSRLVASCTVMGATFPEYEQWYKDAVENAWGWGSVERKRIRDNFREDVGNEESNDEDWDDDKLEDDGFDDEVLFDEPDVLPISSRTPPVGRNDPCPCGSGKKYKKCCLKKEQQPPETFSSKFPIGTLALYGPDDKRTMKIVASVIKREGAEPVLERWVGSNVKDNPKARREIREFFDKHGVKSVVATDRNMGCPHEEGKDFPVGEDCPFCPWWKGKQGSGS